MVSMKSNQSINLPSSRKETRTKTSPLRQGSPPKCSASGASILFDHSKAVFKWLNSVRKGEQNIDVWRQRLGAIEKFEPYTAFTRVDVDQDSSISADDLLRFLR